MQALRISNKGELDLRLILLMGGSTKTEDPTKIGQFGTGLKYAISYLVRTGNPFRLFIGVKEVVFTTEDSTIGDKTFKEIFCDGRSMNITTQYGYQWKAWEAVREIWCNAMDETDEKKLIIKNEAQVKGRAGYTTFFVGKTPDIAEVLTKWDEFFFSGTPLYETDTFAIYPNPNKPLKLYKNGVLIHESPYYTSLFLYDLKTTNLNELRQYMGHTPSDIGRVLLNSSKTVITLLLEAIKDKEKQACIEVKQDWQYLTYNPEKVKEIFSGWLFLHPNSSDSKSAKSIKVNASLFNLLQSIGLPTEQIRERVGGSYGSSGMGYSQDEKVSFREVLNPPLQKRIQSIASKYHSSMEYVIAVPKVNEFDILVDGKTVIFNSSLENLSDADLEATVLVGIFHTQDENLYKAFKRLIKATIGNRNFKKILFGRNVGPGQKPKYIQPIFEAPAHATIDDY